MTDHQKDPSPTHPENNNDADEKTGVTAAPSQGTAAPEPSQILAEKAEPAKPTAPTGDHAPAPTPTASLSEAAPATPATAAAAKPAPNAAKPAAAAAKKAPPPPDPRTGAAKAEAERIKSTITAKFPDAVEEVGAAHFKPMVRIRKEDWAEVVNYLKNHEVWKLNYLECMAGTDYPDYIEIVLFIQSTTLHHFVCLKTRTQRDNAEVPSLSHVYPAVNWEEREIYDLLGVTFTKHPDLRRIMMWDEFTGHPLRKDYSEWDTVGEDADGAD